MTERFLPIDQPLPDLHRADCDAASALSYTLDADWFGHLAAHALPAGESAHWGLAESAQGRVCLPLLIRGRDGGALVNYYSTYYAPILSRPEAAALLPGLLAAVRQRWSSVARWWFHPAAPDGDQDALAAALRSAGLIPFRYFAFGNWYLNSAGMDWEAYLKTRTSKMRSNIKRMTRKLVEESPGSLEVLSTPEQAEEAIRAYATVYATSWKKPEPFPEFIPGLVRTAHLMRHVLEQDHAQEVDYLMGDDEYKRTWMSERRERWGLVAYNPRTPTGLIGLAKEVAGRAVKAARGRWGRSV